MNDEPPTPSQMFMQLKAEIASLQKKLEAHQATLGTHEEDIEVLADA